MTKTAKDILNLARKLSPEQLERLIVELGMLAYLSLPRPANREAIDVELDQCVAEMDANPANYITWEEIKRGWNRKATAAGRRARRTKNAA